MALTVEAVVAGVIELAAAGLQPPVMTSLLLAAAGADLEVLAVMATTAVAKTEAVAKYTPQTGQRRRRGRKKMYWKRRRQSGKGLPPP